MEQCGEGFVAPYESVFSVGVDYVSGPATDTLMLLNYEYCTVIGGKIATKGDDGFGTALSFTAPWGAHYQFNLIYGESSV